jgi:hypothetical protein
MLKHGIAIAFQQENLMSNDPFPKDCLGMYPLAFLMGICNAKGVSAQSQIALQCTACNIAFGASVARG